MPVFLAAGCSSQKNEQSKNTPPFSIAGGDTEKSAALAETEAEKPWVTFIELGSVNCIPCKMMQPVMKEIEEEYAGQVQVVFYDVWTQAGKPYAEQYRIRAIPTQIFLDSEGKEYSRHEGYFPKEELVKVLKQKGVK
ncbi:thioredoxin family protein [bacterium]|nr:thioredoxin family protein [bacterium]